MSFEETDYGPVFSELLNIDRRRDLDEGSPDQAAYDRLHELTIEEGFAHTQIIGADFARCCLAAIWLLYDYLDESHTISQGISTAEGSFWHGIMHRREGDFSNAKYWFRKVGSHPVYNQIEADWDPFHFVDACQAVIRSGGAERDRCRQLQQREWELLFDDCYRQATGS